MLVKNLSILFEPNQFTGFEHMNIVSLLTILGTISIVIWVAIGFSMVIRHLTTLVIRSSLRNHQSHTTKAIGKRYDR